MLVAGDPVRPPRGCFLFRRGSPGGSLCTFPAALGSGLPSALSWLTGPSEPPSDLSHSTVAGDFTSEFDGTQMVVFDYIPPNCGSSC